MTFWFKNN